MYSTSLKHSGVSHTLAPNVSLNPQTLRRLAHSCTECIPQPSNTPASRALLLLLNVPLDSQAHKLLSDLLTALIIRSSLLHPSVWLSSVTTPSLHGYNFQNHLRSISQSLPRRLCFKFTFIASCVSRSLLKPSCSECGDTISPS